MTNSESAGPKIPIRIAVRVDFADGSSHDYEVRGADAAEPPPGFFWPEGVVTQDVAERMRHHREQEAKLASAEVTLATLRRWAENSREIAAASNTGSAARHYGRAARDALAVLDSRDLPPGVPVEFGGGL